MEVRELHLYSPKVGEEDVKNLFNLAVKARFPLFGFLDFSDILSLNAIRVVLKRKDNTIRVFVRETDALRNLSALVFPYRLCERTSLELGKGAGVLLPKAYVIDGAAHDVLDFILKEDIEEIVLGVTKTLGRFVAFGSAIDAKGKRGVLMVSSPQKFLRLDLEKNPSIYMELLEPLPKKMHMSSNRPVFEDGEMSIGAENFDPLQHSLIVGTSGAGKSKALFILLKAIAARFRDSARTVVIDPHGEFAKTMPHAKVIDFRGAFIEPLDVGGEKSPMMTQLIAQLITSTIGQDNKYSERVLFYSVHLLTSLEKLELGNISSLLTDSAIRAELLSRCENPEVKRFFDDEFNDIYIHHFNDAVLPILNFIGEYQLYLGKDRRRVGLMDALNSNRTVIISFDPHFFGRRMISFLAGAIINQMYILAMTGKLMDKPTIMVVDEFPRVETRVTKDILSETRKFNLYAYLSCQYLGQLSKEVLDGIVSNARNIVAFKLNRQDAAILSSMMDIKIEEYFKKSRGPIELEESKKEMFVRLNQRECVARLFDGERYLLPMKLRVVDAKLWGLGEETVAAGGGPGDGGYPARAGMGGTTAECGKEAERRKPPLSGAEAFSEKTLSENSLRDDAPGYGAYTTSVSVEDGTLIKSKRGLRKREMGL